jgi:hypothetical protein
MGISFVGLLVLGRKMIFKRSYGELAWVFCFFQLFLRFLNFGGTWLLPAGDILDLRRRRWKSWR